MPIELTTEQARAYIRSLPDEDLHACIEYDKKGQIVYNDKLIEIRNNIGSNTNPRWALSEVAEELYNRDEISGEELDRITD